MKKWAVYDDERTIFLNYRGVINLYDSKEGAYAGLVNFILQEVSSTTFDFILRMDQRSFDKQKLIKCFSDIPFYSNADSIESGISLFNEITNTNYKVIEMSFDEKDTEEEVQKVEETLNNLLIKEIIK